MQNIRVFIPDFRHLAGILFLEKTYWQSSS